MAASGDIIALITAIGGGGGGTSNYNELSNKPKLNNITIQGNQTAGDYGLFQQLETMPSAVAGLVGKPPIQYVGSTTASLTYGYFYECKESTVTAGTYEWVAVTVQECETVTVDNVSIDYNGSSQLEIKDGGVSSVKLADNAVITAKIADANVTTVKIATSAVITEKIADGNVTIAKIDSGAIATNIRTSSSAVNTKLATEKAVRTELDLKVNVADIKDVLTDASTNKPLSANQGKVLNTIIGNLSNLTTTVKSSVVNAINDVVTKFGDYIKKTDVDGTSVEINSNKLQIKNSGVSTAKLADASITTDKIGANAVTLAKLDSAVFNNTVLTGNTTAVNLEVSGTFNSTSTASLNDVTVSGDIEVPTPTDNVHAANKQYVDDSIASISGIAFTFKGFMSSTAPAATYDLREGNLWYQSTTMPIVFPIAVYRYTSGAWSTTTENYTPNALDMWSDINPSATVEIYYFNGQWKALDPTAIKVDNTSIGKNVNNQLEIKASGVTTAKVQDGSITKAKIDVAANVVYTADAQTLTNKTIDVDSNTVSNIEVDNIKASAVATSIGSSPVNTKLATEKAVGDGLDLKLNIADVDGSTLEVDGTTHRLQIKNRGVGTAKLDLEAVSFANLASDLVTTTVSSASTDNQLPTAKALYDNLELVKVQVSTLPTASADNVGRIYEYVGTTTASYTKGYFYVCVEDTSVSPSTYSWANVKVQDNAAYQEVLDMCHPINSVWVQYTASDNPNTLFNVEGKYSSTWEDISSSFEGRYFKVDNTNTVGTQIAAGLPNIKGRFPGGYDNGAQADATTKDGIQGALGNSGEKFNMTIQVFNAANGQYSSTGTKQTGDAIVYGKSDTVTPLTSTIKVWKRTL